MPTKTVDAAKKRAENSHVVHVLMTYRALIPSVRWFGMEQLRYLASTGVLELRTVPEKSLSARDCCWADWVILTRADTPFELWLAQKLTHLGRKLFYVLDDDLENVPEGLGCSAYYRDSKVVKLGAAIRATCDVLVTHSPLLESLYGSVFAKTVRIEQPAMLEQVCKAKQALPYQSEPIVSASHKDVVRIGFCGSPDRATDVQAVLGGALRALKEHYGNRIELEFFGAHPPLVDELNLSYIPYTASAEEYYQTMAQRHWDIALAPLENTQFYQCKYYNKFVEYCTYGIAGVYSDLPPYREIVHNEVDGVLCSQGDWFSTLCTLIEDKEKCVRIAHAATLRSQDFSLNKVSSRFWHDLGDELKRFRAPNAKTSELPFQMVKGIKGALFAWQTLRRHGLHLLLIVWKRRPKTRKGSVV